MKRVVAVAYLRDTLGNRFLGSEWLLPEGWTIETATETVMLPEPVAGPLPPVRVPGVDADQEDA
jgi:hypothetical protein